MKRITTTITKGGQITLPAEIRRILGVKPSDKVAFEVHGNVVQVVPEKWTLQSVRGSLKPPRPDYDIEQAIREARIEMAEEAVRKFQSL